MDVRNTGRRLILFDVDGTLVDSMRVDGLCFVRALREAFGVTKIDTDWSVYPDTTDSAIVEHVLVNERGHGPSPDETRHLKEIFVRLLSASIASDPTACKPVRGGPELIRRLLESPDYAVGIATGGWEESARLKLIAAGYDVARIPLASSNDASTRTEIITRAADRVTSARRSEDFGPATYVGDGVWDLRAASDLGYDFVGVATNADSALKRKGCRLVSDFRDPDAFLQLVDAPGNQVHSRSKIEDRD